MVSTRWYDISCEMSESSDLTFELDEVDKRETRLACGLASLIYRYVRPLHARSGNDFVTCELILQNLSSWVFQLPYKSKAWEHHPKILSKSLHVHGCAQHYEPSLHPTQRSPTVLL